jgi:hypothetical protein
VAFLAGPQPAGLIPRFYAHSGGVLIVASHGSGSLSSF